jgi:hypothetical protein
MSKQTAVEWLWRWMNDNQEATIEQGNKVFEQAKEIEKQQIEEAWNSAYGGDSNHEGEQYYKETYQDTK